MGSEERSTTIDETESNYESSYSEGSEEGEIRPRRHKGWLSHRKQGKALCLAREATWNLREKEEALGETRPCPTPGNRGGKEQVPKSPSPVCPERHVSKCERRAQYPPFKQALNAYMASIAAEQDERLGADNDGALPTAVEEELWFEGGPLPETMPQDRQGQQEESEEDTQQPKQQGRQQHREQAEQHREGPQNGTRQSQHTQQEQQTERTQREEAQREQQLREQQTVEGRMGLFSVSDIQGLYWMPVRIGNTTVDALVDTGATKSFVTPSIVIGEGLQMVRLPRSLPFVTAGHEGLVVEWYVPQMKIQIGEWTSVADFLVAETTYQVILGTDWLRREEVFWNFASHEFAAVRDGKTVRLPLRAPGGERGEKERRLQTKEVIMKESREAEEARKRMVEDLEGLDADAAAAMVRPAPKRYKGFKNKRKRVPIKEILKQAARDNQKGEVDEMKQPESGCTPRSPDARPGAGAQQGQHDEKDQEMLVERDTLMAIKDINKNRCYQQLQEAILAIPEGGPTFSRFERWLLEGSEKCSIDIKRVLCRYRHLFRDNLPPGLPPERIVNHTITLVPGKIPEKGALYRLPPHELEAQRSIIRQLKDNGWITHTSSPFAAPSMLVGKKDDGSGQVQYRMVINYRALNAITISPEYPLPTIQDVLNMLHGAKVFTVLDMEQGFHQIRVDPHDQYKTAFRTCMGQYEFKVMPFGLKGAPGTFQQVMNNMFFDYLGRGVIVYLDDVLVYSGDIASHTVLLGEVLAILAEHQMYPKISKCRFAMDSIDYLGYRVSAQGITPSPDKVEAVRVWPEVLDNDTQVKQFLGTINYCRMFMGAEFTDLAKPLIDLTKKGTEFKWKQEHTAAVRALKERLMNYTTLQIPDPRKPFVLRTDASGYAVGAVLEQEGHPVGYLSKAMSPAEQRYATYDQELLAVVKALTKWRSLLLVADVTVITDHRALQYLLKPTSSGLHKGRIARWLDFLADFQNLKIEYAPGKTNLVADALSRHPRFMERSSTRETEGKTRGRATKRDSPSNVLAIRPPMQQVAAIGESESPPSGEYYYHLIPEEGERPGTPEWQVAIGNEWWERALENCPEFGAIYRSAKDEAPKEFEATFRSRSRSFCVRPRLLLMRVQGWWRICVPNDRVCRPYVMYQCHDHPTAGHMGIRKTYDLLAR